MPLWGAQSSMFPCSVPQGFPVDTETQAGMSSGSVEGNKHTSHRQKCAGGGTHFSCQLIFHSLCSALKVQGHRVLNRLFGRHGTDCILILAAGGVCSVAWRQGRAQEIFIIVPIVIIIIFMCCSAKPWRQSWSQDRWPEGTLHGHSLI